MNYWSWSGKYIGQKYNEHLYSCKGKPLGYFYESEVYDFNGKYIGETLDNNRLIVDRNKRGKKKSSKIKPCNIAGTSYADYVGYVMRVGYEDFEINF